MNQEAPPRQRLAIALIALLVAQTLFSMLDAWLALSYRGRRIDTGDWQPWFDVRFEYAIPSWIGFGAFWLAGLALIRLGVRLGAPALWCGGSFFVYLGCDDLFQVHERIGILAAPWLGRTVAYQWLLVLGPLFAGATIWLWLELMRRLARPQRQVAAAGFMLLGAAFILEALEKRVQESGATFNGAHLVRYGQCIEEWCECAGPLLIAMAALADRRAGQQPQPPPSVEA